MHAFMFTDIEASTRLWEETPDEMGQALGRHYEILTEAVNGAGGEVIKTTGDGLVAVFDLPADAIQAAVRGQLALATADLTAPLRVRIGIHAGDAEVQAGDYFGPTMNRAARIMAAGHGGQTLISGVVATATGDQLPEGATLRDLGTHRLKDLTLPEHLYQLVHAGLNEDFPPPLTLESSPNNLPPQTTEFLGRRPEITAIRSLLLAPGTRLVTIFGPGGAGKTRLGLQVAAETLDQFRDGAVFVDIAPERDPSSAFEAVVRALDLPASGSGSPLELLQTRLRDREMLLLLDNFEQVTEAATGVAELLQHCPGLKVLVTSRETLRVRAEHVYPVPPLALPDPRGTLEVVGDSEAVQLFVDRARSVRPDFVLDEGNAESVARICLRLDGLPLAIELAAARLSLFDPQTLLVRLEGRLDVLGSGGRDLPDRQRTLWGAIGWSHELLDEPSRRLFEMLSVFSSSKLDSIEKVAHATGHTPDLFGGLASLVDKSLLRSEDTKTGRRFSMLLMVKEFAADQLAGDPDRQEQVRRAHAEHFRDYALELSDRLEGEERQAVLDELGVEIGNLRTAWRYWVEERDAEQLFTLIGSLWTLHDAKGWYHAAIELAAEALEVVAASNQTGERRAEELTLRTSLARALMAVRGYGPEVELAYQEALEMAQASGDADRQYPVLRSLATYYINLANWAKSQELGEQILRLAADEGDEAMEIEGHFVTGASLAFLGDMDRGLGHLDIVIDSFDPSAQGANRFRLGPHSGVSARVASGLLLWQAGRLDEAKARVRDALTVAEAAQHPYSVAYAVWHNGFLELSRGEFAASRRLADELAVVAGENGYEVWATLATVLEGVSLTMMGQPDDGLRLTEAGIELYQGLTTPPVFWPYILLLRGMVHGHAGSVERGIELIDEAIAVLGPVGRVPPEFRVTRGDLLQRLPSPEEGEAMADYEIARHESAQMGLDLLELQAMTRIVGLRRQLGEVPDRADELRVVYDRFTEGFDEHDLTSARAVLGLERDTMGAGAGVKGPP
jgi:predicted ATPase/class 3 adenylate cyclase